MADSNSTDSYRGWTCASMNIGAEASRQTKNKILDSCDSIKSSASMTMWRGPFSRGENTRLTTMTAILSVLYSAKTNRFRWCPYHTLERVSHTGIAIFLDEDCFTIDYTTASEKEEVMAQLSGDDSVESVMQYYSRGKALECMVKGDIVQDIDLTSDTGRSQAMAVLTQLGKEDTTRYHAVTSNCRHHVKRCVRRVAEVSINMTIPFLIAAKDVIAAVDKFLFGAGEGENVQGAN